MYILYNLHTLIHHRKMVPPKNHFKEIIPIFLHRGIFLIGTSFLNEPLYYCLRQQTLMISVNVWKYQIHIRVGLIPLTFSIPPWLLFWSALWLTECTQKFSERLIIIWRWLPALLKYKGICPKIQRKFCCFSFWQFLKKIVLVKNFQNP